MQKLAFKFVSGLALIGVGMLAAGVVRAEIQFDRSVMSEEYWKIWNEEVQRKIDADIERNRKADCEVKIGGEGEGTVTNGTLVKVEQLDHEFRFGAHIFNFNQLGKTEWNDAYKQSYGPGGIFNQATVAFYWKNYEPMPGKLRAGGCYEDTERYWNSIPLDEAPLEANWRRPAPGPVIDFLKQKDVAIHGHILIWGAAKPDWIYDWFCPEEEKRAYDRLGVPRHSAHLIKEEAGAGGNFGYNKFWRQGWVQAYPKATERELAAMAPVFTARMREIFRKRIFDVAGAFGEVVDSWDVVNESSQDWVKYRKSRTGLPVWKSNYGLMPGDYPLDALLDAKAAFPARANLAINDWNICEDFLAQVGDLDAEGAKIDIVGCQMHLFDTNDCMRLAQGGAKANWVGTPGTIQGRLDTMAKTGRPIHVSEVTIAATGTTDRDRMIQAVLARNIYRKWFSHKALMGITWWNTVDGGGVKGEPLVSGLFTRDMQKKPAYHALDQLINHEWRTTCEAKVDGNGVVKFRGFRGNYRLSWTCPRCGHRHCRDVRLTGNGTAETAAPAPLRSREDVRDFTVDGRPVSISCEELLLDIAKIYPDGVGGEGRCGTRWAEVSFKLRARKAGEYELLRINDYFGEMSVNGGKAVSCKGPEELKMGYGATKVRLAAGENTIVFRTRAGLSGKWICGFRVPDGVEPVR